ncbi:MAG: hypothetical protein WAM88_12445 [Nitrososphaeraceae archaeon]
MESIITIVTIYNTNEIRFLQQKSKCVKCGKKFKNPEELMDHNHIAHAT